jgi:D-2-hydroxyacid dehydrogenase (NADP+)
MSEVLFCTDTFWAEYADRVRVIAPDIEVVLLEGDQPVSDADLERITIASFSHDAWPERAGNWFGAAMRAPNLAWLHSMSAGVDSPVFATFLERGVRLSNSPGASAAPIARTVMMYLLALARDLPRMMRAQAKGEWAWARWTELEGKQLAVLGWGPIGQEIARLANEFGMQPVIVRRAAKGDEPFPVRPLADLRDVAAEVDALAVALPLTDDTRGLISADVFAAMQSHAFFVNVGRGELVDQAALTDALSSGQIAGAGLDVTDPEPLPADDPLWSLPNVIITPHNSGSTVGTGRRANERFLENLTTWVTDGTLATET